MWIMNRGKASGPVKFYKNCMPRACPSMRHAHGDDELSMWDVSWVGDPVTLGVAAGGAVRHKPHLRRVSFPFGASPECAGEQARLLVSCFSAPVTSPLSKLGNHSHISKNHSVFSLRFYRISSPPPTQQQPCQNNVKNRLGNTFHICRQSWMVNSVYVQQMYITLELGTEVYRVIQRTYTCEKDFSENEAKDKP